MSQEKIKKMFNDLSAEEQGIVLAELNSSKKTLQINTNEISSFAQKHQREYQSDITFDIEVLDNGTIQATLKTIFGNFKGIGTNQKIAKINAVKLANECWD
ncbi:MAG TPA: hypothetical protein PLO94_11045 [Chitinophagales bacterium]|nr:hypothetical protein [Chitinophagales bacterium]